jgi:lipopolysaccharide transport system permease protein
MNNTDENIEIIIEPNKNWFYIDWRGLFHYRDLLFLLVRRDFVAQYKQTILGPLWFVIQPLLMTIVFTVIFGKIAKISTDEIPPMLFYLSGLLGWRYFADCFNSTSSVFIGTVDLFSKVYFPRLIIPFSTIISHLFTFAIQLATFLGFYVYYKFFTGVGSTFSLNGMVLFLPLFVLQTALLSLGMGLLMSALTAKYRDLRFLMGFFTQLWMYVTPVIYPMSLVPDKWKWAVALNPMAPIIEYYRYAFFGTGVVELQYFVISLGITFFVLMLGLVLFNKVERTFIDTV